MAKLAFNKLGLKLNKDVVELHLSDEVTIEVKQYLPQNDKVELAAFVLENSIDENNSTFSPIRMETFFSLAIVKYYTNITFTDKQLAEAAKTYDLLESNGVFKTIANAIPKEEYEFLVDTVYGVAKDVATYNNSFAGMLKSISNDAGAMDAQFAEIFEKIKNAEGLEQLSAIKDIVG